MRSKSIDIKSINIEQWVNFLNGLIKKGSCWVWGRGKNKLGYGTLRIKNNFYLAHRLSFALFHGLDPAGLLVCHSCDNPPCCNPDHLFLGTDSDNANDMSKKRRSTYGEKSGMSKVTEQDVIRIRTFYPILKRTRINNKKIPAQKILGNKYGLTEKAVSSIIRRKCWKHI